MGALLFFLAIAITIGVGYRPAYKKYKELNDRRWERKLLTGLHKAELQEMEENWKPSDQEIADAERELEKEMQEW